MDHQPSPSGFDGIIAVPATPFTDDNLVDVASLRRYAQNALAQGAVGFLAPAVAGEVETLSQAERELIVTTLLSEVKGRAIVIGGISDPDPAKRLAHAQRFIQLGCHGIVAHIRYEDDATYLAAVRAVGELNPPFLMIQDLDSGVGPLPVPLIARLHREVPCFTWIKLETGDRCRKLTEIRQATGGTLHVGSAGPDLLELLDRGIDSYMVTNATDIYHRIWSLYRSGQREEATTFYRRFLPCLAFMATHQKIQWRFTKALLHAGGIFSTTRVRLPAPALDPVETNHIGELIHYVQGLSAEIAPTP